MKEEKIKWQRRKKRHKKNEEREGWGRKEMGTAEIEKERFICSKIQVKRVFNLVPSVPFEL